MPTLLSRRTVKPKPPSPCFRLEAPTFSPFGGVFLWARFCEDMKAEKRQTGRKVTA